MANYIPPSRRGTCSSCGKAIYLTRTSRPEPVCQPCRRARHGYGSYKRGCRCEVCRQAAVEIRSKGAPCSECSRPSLARGLCSTHYAYWYRREVSGEWRVGGWISREARLAIYERDDWTCQLCGKPVDREADPERSNDAPSLDHIEPQSHVLVPDHRPTNLRTAHRGCNSKRGAKVAA